MTNIRIIKKDSRGTLNISLPKSYCNKKKINEGDVFEFIYPNNSDIIAAIKLDKKDDNND